MKNALAVALIASLICPALKAQKPEGDFVFKSESNLVVVDVVVSSKQGVPPRIDRDAWQVFEDGHPLPLSSVEFSSSVSMPAPTLGGSGWSDNLACQTRAPEATGTTVLVIDALNTSPTVQAKAKHAALRALEQLPGHERFIVFYLGADLKQVSGYTNDLAAVRDFIRGQPVQEAQMRGTPGADLDRSFAAPSAAPSSSTNPSLNAGSGSGMFQQFQRREQIDLTNQRIKTTLAAMQAIADIVAHQPGRKSLIWLTSSFPLNLGPGPAYLSGVQNVMPGTDSGPSRYFDLENYTHELDKLGKTMSEARVAIYPILVDTLSSGIDNATAAMPTGINDSRIQERMSAIAAADQTAKLTGGVSTANTNDYEGAFRRAVGDADAYYTLSFVPRGMKLDGSFHKLELRTTQPGVELHYRPGFYAEPPKESDPRKMLKAAMVPDTPQSTGVETAARLTAGKPATLELRIGSEGLVFESLPGGRRKASLLVGFMAASKDGKHPQEGISPAEFTLSPEQFEEVRQRGLPVSLQLKPPSGDYILRAAVIDLNSRRIGSVDVGTALQPARAAATPEPVSEIAGQPLYPELGRLTATEYENYFFNFKLLIPSRLTVRSDSHFPIPPRGSHVLLALEFSGAENTERPAHGSLTIFAEDATFAKTTDPHQAANNEVAGIQKEYKDVKVWGPFDDKVGVCIGAGYSNCTLVAFYQRKGYLLKFVTHSDFPEDLFGGRGYVSKVSRQISAPANSVVFSSNPPKHLPTAAELYAGPAVPAVAIDKAIASPFQIEAGTLDGRTFEDKKLHLSYTFPAEWAAMSADEGRDHFASLHAIAAGDPDREREHRFFYSCLQPLLYLRPSAADSAESGDLTLVALSTACLGLRQTNWSDKNAITTLASQLSMLHDIGDIKSAHAESIAGHPFLVLSGMLNSAGSDSALLTRRSQTIYLTGEGEYMLGWFLTGKRPRAVDAFPAEGLKIGDEPQPEARK
jgi:VWFA-related protein